MFNRGHWKMFKKTEAGAELYNQKDKNGKQGYNIKGANAENFATDFLVDRTLEIMARDKGKPFCIMLSLPDPHGPNTVRAPYDTMYNKMVFEMPGSMQKLLADPSIAPKWNLKSKGWVKSVNQQSMAKYFGMGKMH